MLHIVLIAVGAYLCVAVLGYLLVLPILRAGKAVDKSMAGEKLPRPLTPGTRQRTRSGVRFRRSRGQRRAPVS